MEWECVGNEGVQAVDWGGMCAGLAVRPRRHTGAGRFHGPRCKGNLSSCLVDANFQPGNLEPWAHLAFFFFANIIANLVFFVYKLTKISSLPCYLLAETIYHDLCVRQIICHTSGP